jgi:hypothetical protein
VTSDMPDRLRKRLRSQILLRSCVPLLLILGGCSSNAVELGTVHGRVIMQGRPLADVVVTFVPELPSQEKLPISIGTTDADGNYCLSTDEGLPGAVVGTHRVTVEELRPGNPAGDNSREAQDQQPVVPRSVQPPPRVPERYRTAGTSPIQLVVKAGDNALDLSLSK